jgi:hypothetical protein
MERGALLVAGQFAAARPTRKRATGDPTLLRGRPASARAASRWTGGSEIDPTCVKRGAAHGQLALSASETATERVSGLEDGGGRVQRFQIVP